jgi:hypothetical protein
MEQGHSAKKSLTIPEEGIQNSPRTQDSDTLVGTAQRTDESLIEQRQVFEISDPKESQTGSAVNEGEQVAPKSAVISTPITQPESNMNSEPKSYADGKESEASSCLSDGGDVESRTQSSILVESSVTNEAPLGVPRSLPFGSVSPARYVSTSAYRSNEVIEETLTPHRVDGNSEPAESPNEIFVTEYPGETWARPRYDRSSGRQIFERINGVIPDLLVNAINKLHEADNQPEIVAFLDMLFQAVETRILGTRLDVSRDDVIQVTPFVTAGFRFYDWVLGRNPPADRDDESSIAAMLGFAKSSYESFFKEDEDRRNLFLRAMQIVSNSFQIPHDVLYTPREAQVGNIGSGCLRLPLDVVGGCCRGVGECTVMSVNCLCESCQACVQSCCNCEDCNCGGCDCNCDCSGCDRYV